jgi:ATP-dependent RNA helicase DDX18/HAS1
MFLQPSEVGFLKHLKEARVPVVEFEFPAKRIVNVQSQLEKLIVQNYYLNKVCPSLLIPLSLLSVLDAPQPSSLAYPPHRLKAQLKSSSNHSSLLQSAKEGYRSYLQAYASHSLRSVFDVNKLDLVKVAKSFGFPTPPRVDITLGASMSRDKKQQQQGRRNYGSQPRHTPKFKRKYEG